MPLNKRQRRLNKIKRLSLKASIWDRVLIFFDDIYRNYNKKRKGKGKK